MDATDDACAICTSTSTELTREFDYVRPPTSSTADQPRVALSPTP